MNLIAKLLMKIRFDPNGSAFGGLINFISFRKISRISVYRFEHRFNKKMRLLTQEFCTHPTTYEDHYWSGGHVCCSVCHRRLKTLWLPTKVG